VSEKHLVACPRCGFRITDQGEPANPGLTRDIQTFSRTCPLIADQLSSKAEQPFDCPELLKAVRSAALSGEAGRTR
jgi:hypothetical protein